MTSDVRQQLPRSEWQAMSTEQRTAFLANLLGSRIRWVLLNEALQGRRVFGADYPLRWHEGDLCAFEEMYGERPGIQVAPRRSRMGTLGGAHAQGRDLQADGDAVLFESQQRSASPMSYAFDDLYDVQSPATRGEGGGGGNGDTDVYAETNTACPHCGARLRISQRATVEEA